MGKKGAASTSSGKTALKDEPSLTPLSKDSVTTGVFSSDVPILCTRHDIPLIAVYSKDSVQIQRFSFIIDSDDADSDITSVHVRGWRVTDAVATVLSEALASCKTLHSLHLWNTGLSVSGLGIINKISFEHSIRELNLDGTYLISALPIVETLKCNKSLVKLSMKSCGITDQFIRELSHSLAHSTTLLHLILSCNAIGDEGCTVLASCLRLNHTLLSLHLTANSIGDYGVSCVAKVLTPFPLEHSEIVEIRKLHSLHGVVETRALSSTLELHLDRRRDSSPHGRSSSTALNKTLSKGEKLGKKKGAGEPKKDEKFKKEDKTKKGLEPKKVKNPKDGKSTKKVEEISESPQPEAAEVVNPLLELKVKREEGQLFLPGNTTLIYLGLAFNQIGSVGVHKLLEALQVQSSKTGYGTGLLRLTLHHNSPRMHGIKLSNPSDHQSDLEQIETILAKKQAETAESELMLR